MADLDLQALRLDAAARLNGGGRADLDERTEQLRRERAEIKHERKLIRGEWRRLAVGWALLLLTTMLLCAFWPNLMSCADLMWRR